VSPAIIGALGISSLLVLLFVRVPVWAALTLVGDWRKSGARMVVIGLGAAAVGFAVGRLFGGGA